MHFQFIFLILFVIIFLGLSRKKLHLTFYKSILSTLSFLFLFIPLLIFDLRHQFLNAKLFLGFFTSSVGTVSQGKDLFSWIPVFINVIEPFVCLKSTVLTILFYIAILCLTYALYKRKTGFLKSFYLSTLVLWLVFPIVFMKYGQRPSEYYFIFLYPFIYVIIIDFFISFKKTYLLLILIGILFILNMRIQISNLRTDYGSLLYKDRLIKQLIPYTRNKKFNISYGTPLGRNTGFQYLLEYYSIKQSGDWNDPLIQIKIPVDNQYTFKSGDMEVFIPKELSR